MSCCNNSFNTAAPAFTEARSQLSDDLSNSCNSAVYYAPAQSADVITPVRGCDGAHDCTPIPVTPLCPREYRLCRDQNGCATRYPADCRNLYWPNFAHPRWLPCDCLYCTGNCRVRRNGSARNNGNGCNNGCGRGNGCGCNNGCGCR